MNLDWLWWTSTIVGVISYGVGFWGNWQTSERGTLHGSWITNALTAMSSATLGLWGVAASCAVQVVRVFFYMGTKHRWTVNPATVGFIFGALSLGVYFLVEGVPTDVPGWLPPAATVINATLQAFRSAFIVKLAGVLSGFLWIFIWAFAGSPLAFLAVGTFTVACIALVRIWKKNRASLEPAAA